MFRIVSYESTPEGNTRFIVESDDSTTAILLRLFSQADKFAQMLHNRLTTESRLESSQKTRTEKMARAGRSRADLLKRFREIRGSHSQRLKILKEKLACEGNEMTLDRLSAAIQIAREEEKLHKQLQVKELIRQGKTLSEIASSLSIPKSTAARYARAKGYEERSLMKIVDHPKEAGLSENRYLHHD